MTLPSTLAETHRLFSIPKEPPDDGYAPWGTILSTSSTDIWNTAPFITKIQLGHIANRPPATRK